MSAKAGTSDIGTYIAAAGFFLVTPYGLGVIGGDGLRPVFIAVGVAMVIGGTMLSTKLEGKPWWWQIPFEERKRQAQEQARQGRGGMKALNDVDKILGTSAPPAKPAARRSSSRRTVAAATPVAETPPDAQPTRKRRAMSKRKKAVSERMTVYWAERRKAERRKKTAK